ncbi:MAG: hypothetical protein JNL33_16360, partial [Betaproteobacteria bacterium]|nr:hypothetical protein [Betaproteobacteria bacterium]
MKSFLSWCWVGVLGAVVSGTLALWPTTHAAEEFPSRPVTIIVPWPSGS